MLNKKLQKKHKKNKKLLYNIIIYSFYSSFNLFFQSNKLKYFSLRYYFKTIDSQRKMFYIFIFPKIIDS